MKDKYAVINVGGGQYLVREGDELDVMRLSNAEAAKIIFDRVLLVRDEDKVRVGQPTVDKAKVKAEIGKHFRGKKIRVATYKAKSRYRRVKGHRDELTRIKIIKITE